MEDNKSIISWIKVKYYIDNIKAIERYVRQKGYTIQEIICINLISINEKVTAAFLGQLFDLSPSRISKILSSLEEKKLIQRIIAKDKRACYFVLTKQGEVVLCDLTFNFSKDRVPCLFLQGEYE